MPPYLHVIFAVRLTHPMKFVNDAVTVQNFQIINDEYYCQCFIHTNLMTAGPAQSGYIRAVQGTRFLSAQHC